ncbi:MAG TPA: hypothetical protein VG034_02345 [Acidimicrobiia bacterium]|nr:hypothetical protein [Acidimicrobiia bacterium]
MRCTGPADLDALGREIAGNLRRLGLGRPDVSVSDVDHLPAKLSGKLRRFVPLAAVGARANGGEYGPSVGPGQV